MTLRLEGMWVAVEVAWPHVAGVGSIAWAIHVARTPGDERSNERGRRSREATRVSGTDAPGWVLPDRCTGGLDGLVLRVDSIIQQA